MTAETGSILALVQRLAREAGALQRARYESTLEIGTKSSAVDLVTEVDHACEELVVGGIRAARPDDAILAEEGGDHATGTSGWRWLVDPLDGTVNYAHAYPWFCVSIGVERDGRVEVAAVYNPLLDELYHAVRGGGAFRNGRAIRVSDEKELARSLLATGFAYDRQTDPRANLGLVETFLRRAGGIRRSGSAALDLASVACGRLDGYWELRLAPWDVAAGSLLVREAGGQCTNFAGAADPIDGVQILASNGHIHAAMLESLR